MTFLAKMILRSMLWFGGNAALVARWFAGVSVLSLTGSWLCLHLMSSWALVLFYQAICFHMMSYMAMVVDDHIDHLSRVYDWVESTKKGVP